MVRNANFYNIDNVYIIIIVSVILTSRLFVGLSSAISDNSALVTAFAQNEDPQMGTKDLAFFFLTHDFDAALKNDRVDVQIDSGIYDQVHNGQYPVLANATNVSMNKRLKK